MLKIGDFRIYFTWNWRLKTRNKREDVEVYLKTSKHRKNVYKRANGKCEICGVELAQNNFEMHHVLPLGKFKHLSTDERNMKCLCHKCHKYIHCEPFVAIREMKEKASELGIELKDYYEI